jgi:site-specific DNA-methyltransferase (adenine-specific)
MSKEFIGSLELNRIYQHDCIEGMRMIPDKSVDMILCDLPYGTTACKWDTIIPFDLMWEQYERIIKDNGAIVLTASQPFTSALVMSNPKLFKYEWIWEKNRGSNFATVKYMPMKEHESVLVFYKKKPTYNEKKIPRSEQGRGRVQRKYIPNNKGKREVYNGLEVKEHGEMDKDWRCARSIVKHNVEVGLHPTQKPVSLFQELIEIYTNEDDIVLDNCMGSGTTAVASVKTNRRFIGFETEREYVEIANKRLDDLEVAE